MILKTHPGQPLRGTIKVPGDKSLSHRAALLAAMAEGYSIIDNFLVAGVTQAMLNGLTACGILNQLEGDRLTIQGQGISGFNPPSAELNCGNSATTIRLLAGVLAAEGIPAILDGSAGLRRRPMDRIVAPLQEMGVPIHASAGGTAPLELSARPADKNLKGITYRLPVSSAQVKSCLLLAALAVDAPTTLVEPETSRDHTERMLTGMGVRVEDLPDMGYAVHSEGKEHMVRLFPPEPRRLTPLDINLPGDLSAAAFLIVAALIVPGSDITIENVGLNPTRTGLLDVLAAMGANLTIFEQGMAGNEPFGSVAARYSELVGMEIPHSQVVRMIDEFPTFAVAASLADGITTVHGAGELRHKESDRIASLTALSRLGAGIAETSDGFSIQGMKRLTGGSFPPSGDHRMSMAFAVAGLAAQTPVELAGAEIIAESYPGFVDALRQLGADLEMLPG